MLKFEMCAAQLVLFWLLSRESGVSFTEAQPRSILTALYFEFAEKNLVNTSSHNSMFECCSAKYESYQRDCFDTSYKSTLQVWLF